MQYNTDLKIGKSILVFLNLNLLKSNYLSHIRSSEVSAVLYITIYVQKYSPTICLHILSLSVVAHFTIESLYIKAI
jgi:hypothetical protein